MPIDWGTLIPKGLITIVVSWAVKTYRKPVIDWSKKQYKLGGELAKVTARLDECEKEIAINRDTIEAMIRISQSPLYQLNDKGELIKVNPAWLKAIGVSSPEDAYGMQFMAFIHDEDLEWIKREARSLLEHPSSWKSPKKLRFKNPENGDIIVTDGRSELIKDNTGKIVKTIGILYVIETIKNNST